MDAMRTHLSSPLQESQVPTMASAGFGKLVYELKARFPAPTKVSMSTLRSEMEQRYRSKSAEDIDIMTELVVERYARMFRQTIIRLTKELKVCPS